MITFNCHYNSSLHTIVPLGAIVENGNSCYVHLIPAISKRNGFLGLICFANNVTITIKRKCNFVLLFLRN